MMNQHSSIDVTDKDGWHKTFPLEKNLIHIGSDVRNDIVLESWRGAGVAPRHLQLIASPADRNGFRVVNLGDTDVVLGAAGDQTLIPRSSADIVDEEYIRIGDFRLFFHSGGAPMGPGSTQPTHRASSAAPATRITKADARSKLIGLELFLPKTQLEPDQPIDGSVIVRNLGTQPAVQFKMAVEGVPSECYDIGAGPLLFPNAEKEIVFRLLHPKGPTLPANEYRVSIHAKAPEAYPGEQATVSQVIRVLPFYKHKLRLAVATE